MELSVARTIAGRKAIDLHDGNSACDLRSR